MIVAPLIGQYFWDENYRTNITQIITTNTLNMPNNVIRAWDISKGAGNLIAYIVDDNTGNNTYIAYIACDGSKIYAYDNWNSFNNFTSVEKIDLTYLDTSYVTNMQGWFGSCKNLKEIIGLENFNTSNVTNMMQMFAYCDKLENLDLRNFKTDKLTSTDLMFFNCSNLETLRLNTYSLENLTSYENMFNGITSGINIYVPDVETAKFIYDRLNDASRTGTIYYGTEDNWAEYIA